MALSRNALSNAPLFAGWSQSLVDQLASASSARAYARGAHVTTGVGHERQALLVVSGVVELSQPVASGRRFLLRLVGPGEVTGLIRLFEDADVDYGYVVRECSTVIHIPCVALLSALNQRFELWPSFVRSSLEGSSGLVGNVLEQVIVGSAEQRIAATLRRLSLLFGVQSDVGVRLGVRLSQDDLADMLCVSRQTVNKELRGMEEARILSCSYSTITIIDNEALAQLARGRTH